jgi:ABC-2 type transport system permease protein
MTTAVLETARAPKQRAGRWPGAVVAVQVGRRAARSGLLWGSIFGIFVIAQTLAYTSGYKTQAARDQMAAAFGSNVGLNALLGRARDINTVTGYSAWRLLGILSILGAIWGLLTSTRLLRGDEDAGRYELLLTGQTTRRRAALQAVVGLGLGLACLFALTAAGTILTGRAASVGFSIGQCLYFSLALVASAAVMLAVGTLSSQLADTRRRAAAIASVVFGVFYALRMVADSDPGLHWLAWLSPLGWIEESRPLTHPRPLALLAVIALVLAVATLSVHLAGIRDVGAGILPARDTSPSHLRLLGSPTGLAIRLMRPTAVGWLGGVAACSLLLGTVAASSTNDIAGGTSVQKALGRLGTHGSLAAAYLGLTFLILALMIALIAAGQIVAIRTEEADGHLENLTVRPVSRTSWLAGRLLLSALLIVVVGVLAGVSAWVGSASQHSGVGFGASVAAGLNIVPPSLFLLGLGALVFGRWPRRTSAVVYGYLTWSFLIEFIGATANVNHWLLDTSVFFHMVPAPATSPNWTSAAALAGLGLGAAVIGGLFLNRRDLAGV